MKEMMSHLVISNIATDNPLSPDRLSAFSTRLLWWILGSIFIYALLYVVVRTLARRNESEVDDVILDVSRIPLLLTISTWGIANSLEQLSTESYMGTIEQICYAFLVLVVTYWFWRIVKDVIIYYMSQRIHLNESAVDDMLIPILNKMGPILIFIIGGTFALQALGVDIALVITAIGGISFITAFALQDTLSNVFAGIALLWDTPYRFGDFIILENGTVCQVKEPGIRVTVLVNLSNYSVIYMPNSVLANQSLVNITRPTPDLISGFEIGVAYDTDLYQVTEILEKAVTGHPDVLGTQLESQISAIQTMRIFNPRERLPPQSLSTSVQKSSDHIVQISENDQKDNTLLDTYKSMLKRDKHALAKRDNGLERFRAEQEANQILLSVRRDLEMLEKEIKQAESGGLSKSEIDSFFDKYKAILTSLGWNAERRTGRRKRKEVMLTPNFGTHQNAASDNAMSAIRTWVHIWSRDPDLLWDEVEERRKAEGKGEKTLWELGHHGHELTEDEHILFTEWETRIYLLENRLIDLGNTILNPGGKERRVDDKVGELLKWMNESFKAATPGWKDPEVSFVNFGASSLDFKVEYYIDHVGLELFGRTERVNDQIKREVLTRFREEGIEIPFPQQDIWCRASAPQNPE